MLGLRNSCLSVLSGNGNEHVTGKQAMAKQCSMSPRVMQDDGLEHLIKRE